MKNKLVSQYYWVLLCCYFFSISVQSDDWPQWRGIERSGNWKERGILERFPADGPKLRWSASIGSGYSGPSVSRGKVFVMDRLVKPLGPDGSKYLHEGTALRRDNHVRIKHKSIESLQRPNGQIRGQIR